jgi:SAM-dependent methyltransferase
MTATALDRTAALLADPPAAPDTARGYLDLLGDDGDPTQRHLGPRLMVSSAVPLIYERLWRPVWGQIFLGAGPGMDEERRIARELLALAPGDRVLDVGCGPGNFTRDFAGAVAPGLAVGVDASPTMLARAVAEAGPDNLAYVRADAAHLPFADGTFDAVCCFAALYFIADPSGALDEIVRVLAPGGRVALLSSVNRGLLPTPVTDAVVRTLSGVRIFDRAELTGALTRRGLRDVTQRVSGFGQFVGGRAAR